jgi:hypothetical protein
VLAAAPAAAPQPEIAAGDGKVEKLAARKRG